MTNTEKSKFDRDSFHDFVESHGEGSPTEEGYNLGELLILLGDDYATAAAEVSRRGMTARPADWSGDSNYSSCGSQHELSRQTEN